MNNDIASILIYFYTLLDQDTARYSFYSVEEKRVSLTEPYTTDNLFSSRVFLLNIGYACSKSLESKYDKFL